MSQGPSQALIQLQSQLLSPTTLETLQRSLPPSLAKHITAERLANIALSTIGRTPAIANCTMESVIKCVIEVGQYGLALGSGSMAQAFFVPYGKECTTIISWPGFVELGRRGGEILDVSANCIYKGDKYIYQEGFEAQFIHEPNIAVQKVDADIIAAYCVTYYANGHKSVQVMPRSEIDKRRQASPTGKGGSGPWAQWYPEMAIKSVIKLAAKRWPKTEELSKALLDDEEKEGFVAPNVFESKLGAPAQAAQIAAGPTEAEVLNAIESAGNLKALYGVKDQIQALPEGTRARAQQAYAVRSETLRNDARISKSAAKVMEKLAATPRAPRPDPVPREPEVAPWEKHLPAVATSATTSAMQDEVTKS